MSKRGLRNVIGFKEMLKVNTLSKKHTKQTVVLILTCFMFLCFAGCSSQSSELTKDGDFSNPPIQGDATGVATYSSSSEMMTVPVNTDQLQWFSEVSPSQFPSSFSATFTLVYMDNNSEVLFIDNVTDDGIGAGHFCYDEDYANNVEKYGSPETVDVYITQVNASWPNEKVKWGFSSTSLALMEQFDYFKDAIKVLQEKGVYCGEAQIF